MVVYYSVLCGVVRGGSACRYVVRGRRATRMQLDALLCEVVRRVGVLLC